MGIWKRVVKTKNKKGNDFGNKIKRIKIKEETKLRLEK
jgi:hypothetical protein